MVLKNKSSRYELLLLQRYLSPECCWSDDLQPTLAKTLTTEMGKPTAQAKNEVRATVDRVKFYLGNYEKVSSTFTQLLIHVLLIIWQHACMRDLQNALEGQLYLKHCCLINIDSVTEKEYVWYGTAGPEGADCFRDNPSEGESTI